MRTACAATVATTAVAALATGLTGPAQATPVPTAVKSAEATGKHSITLITGDRVIVDVKGRVVGMERAKGRERIPVQIRRFDGHTLVVPTDAARMIASGRLDQRLFDITELDKAATRKVQKNGLKVIVGYKGTANTAKSDVRDTGTLRQALRSLNADALRTPKKETPALWDAVTDGDTLASGIAHVWLDGVRRASLDKSVPQIGAPTAWAKGYTGKGVKVAVLDTGVDTDHPDLRTQVIASKNFTKSATTLDHFGHGTHVASIVAGTGAKSGGKYKGVAPGAQILNGKVLDDSGGGDDSTILAGMEWAAQQGADIVNLSLGATDTPGIDPLEAEVNKLSETKGILFAIAAGNEGEDGPQTIDSPGSAADALTVGAVDGKDRLASFSSTGPTADGALKPDVTAPGVDITAAAAPGSELVKEVGEKPAGYLTISGTSMATPHVAGAAAILKQEHPDWTYAELKAALVGSAKGGDYAPLEQGSGRIQVDKAIGQTVVAEPSSVDFPAQRWPHTDDTPVTRKLTYRNLGKKDVTLALSAKGSNPGGQAAPAGFFTLGAKTVTVPAGGKASVDVTVNTKLGGKLDGTYSAYVTATGDGTIVRGAVGVLRETEMYDVTVKFINRPGQTPTHFTTLASTVRGSGGYTSQTTANTVTFRVPKGGYILDSFSMKDPDSTEGGVDWLTQPVLNVTKDTTITLDLNRTRSADITVPDARAKSLTAMVAYEYRPANVAFNMVTPSFSDIRLAHVGPAMPSGLFQTWSGQWNKGSGAEYDIVGGAEVKKVSGTRVHHYKASEFATMKAGLGASAPGRTGILDMTVAVSSGYGLHTPVEQKLPATRTLYLSTGEGAEWYFDFEQYSGKKDSDGNPISDAHSDTGDYLKLAGGRTYQQTFNTGVFAPRVVSQLFGVFHSTDGIYGMLPLFADGKGHAAGSDLTSVRTTLYRGGRKVGSNADPLTGNKTFKVPAGEAAYRLTTTARRSAEVQAASTRVDASWTFHSEAPSTGLPTELPVSTVRFQAKTGLDSRVEAGRTVTYPVTVEGAAKRLGLKSLSVYVSYDDGRTWKKTDVRNGRITVRNPARGKGISLRAKVVDKKGNGSTITIHNAYYGK
ncbi:S8 family peptidase [Streptomyces fulvoviolaceus]|uniref:S8 family peptidase n=1 Tax=Streptomyces fulvoviolaceus TaxID=285535 RepID=UPI0021BEBF21|nr:S8 family serine peptidase [Streptomyces fulvoviolaceus]MCT9075158.1 S8 family serine peptidase [Streptomyces fulvoviolaceus]